MPGVTLDHLVGRLKAGIGDLRYRKLLMVGLLSRNDWSISDQGEMDPGIGDKVSLELIQVHVQGAIESQGCSDGGNNLANQPVEVGVSWPLNVQVPAADVIDGLIVNHEGAVRVLKSRVGGQDGLKWRIWMNSFLLPYNISDISQLTLYGSTTAVAT